MLRLMWESCFFIAFAGRFFFLAIARYDLRAAFLSMRGFALVPRLALCMVSTIASVFSLASLHRFMSCGYFISAGAQVASNISKPLLGGGWSSLSFLT